ncbi:calcium-binding protein [Geobacter sp.]|uniref:calcium-binding protein n=1 Tax=Geobacter sp. TaxID=46610 RepID=UPI001AD24EEA|nr:hypothetical protein [Geobacter sp.]CAG0968377.1 hypothetical protein ANRL4_01097 [Anaerolineae bacterium]
MPKRFYADFDTLLAKWAGVESIDPTAMRGAVTDRMITIVEKFLGWEYQRVIPSQEWIIQTYVTQGPPPGYQIVGYREEVVSTSVVSSSGYSSTVTTEVQEYDKQRITNMYNSLKDMFFVDFIAQTSIGSSLGIGYDFFKDKIQFDSPLSPSMIVANLMDSSTIFTPLILLKALKENGQLDMTTFDAVPEWSYIKNPVLNWIANPTSFVDVQANLTADLLSSSMIAVGSDADNTISSTSSADLIFGNDGADTLQGNCGDDALLGGCIRDVVYLSINLSSSGSLNTIFSPLPAATLTPARPRFTCLPTSTPLCPSRRTAR